MSVYVDSSAHSFGRMVMCHMIADTPADLRFMAGRIGVASKWFQRDAAGDTVRIRRCDSDGLNTYSSRATFTKLSRFGKDARIGFTLVKDVP